MSASTAEEEQSTLLEEAFGFVAEQRFYMRKAIQHNNMEMALRYGLCLANELRSSHLLPENYYKLYALVFWELQHFAAFIASKQHGLSIGEVYELVQYEGNVLPRLYMLVTVGVVHMQSSDTPTCDVLEDLSSMLSAVQHPVRGLFLRYYLLQMVKDKLLALRGARGALLYLLCNLRESVSLWSRMRLDDGARGNSESLGSTEDETWRLDRNRHTLRLLVGAHIMHMARLRSLTAELHSEIVLPDVLRLSTACEDPAGQAYLLQCFIEVSPDHFHLRTLDRVLAACAQVHWVVDLRPLLQLLMRRLTAHLRQSEPQGVDMFMLLHAHLRQLHARPRTAATPLASLLQLQLELAVTALALHPSDAERMEMVLASTVELLGEELDLRSVEAVIDIMAAPFTQERLVPAVLAMPHHAKMMAALGLAAQREGALAIVTALLAGDVALNDPETLQQLFTLVDRLVRDEGDVGKADAQRHIKHDAEAFTVEQEKMARLVHQVRHADTDVAFQMLSILHGFFNEGGSHRIVFTLPALVVATLRLLSHFLDRRTPSGHSAPKTSPDELFQFANAILDRLGSLLPSECLRLWMLCVSASERASVALLHSEFAAVCANFITKGLVCLEEQVHDAEARFRGLQLMVGTLRGVTCLPGSSFEQAAERMVQVGGQLPTARLQSKALCLCSGLFRGRRALGCLRAALRLADSAVHVDPLDVELFVSVLDEAVHQFGRGNEEITASFLSGLLALCFQHLQYVESRAPTEVLRGLHIALTDLQEKQARAREEAMLDDLGACLLSTKSADVDGHFAKLHLQLSAAGLGVPAPVEAAM